MGEKCPECGADLKKTAEWTDSYRVCPNCGTILVSEIKRIPAPNGPSL